jgi:hypothetical protein
VAHRDFLLLTIDLHSSEWIVAEADYTVKSPAFGTAECRGKAIPAHLQRLSLQIANIVLRWQRIRRSKLA